MKNVFFTTQKTSRITELIDKKAKNENLLIVLHGYGQLTTFFSRKLQDMDGSGFDIILPEALNRFYLEGSAGRVGASWMTKEEREQDIQDNHRYLENILKSYSSQYKKMVLMGFSQGGATAARFYSENKTKLNGLILWSSVFPPDIDSLKSVFTKQKDFFVLGNDDPYFKYEKQKEVLTLHQELGFETITFEGKHDLNSLVLQSILTNF
jgi:predicted esterase